MHGNRASEAMRVLQAFSLSASSSNASWSVLGRRGHHHTFTERFHPGSLVAGTSCASRSGGLLPA